MNLKNFRFDVDGDGIAVLTWDMPDRSMNVITQDVIAELSEVIEKVASDAGIKGCVITSGKSNFSGGADLTMLEGFGSQLAAKINEEGYEKAMQFFFDATRSLSLLYRRLETSGKPFVAAIDGVALGGAFELALACHYRVLSDNPKTRVGLPEVKVGLFPGAGGTQRIARLMQTGDALQMLFKGDQLRAPAAKSMGLVHEVAPAAEIVAKAKAWISAGGKGVAPWDDPKFKPPSGRVFSAQGMMVWAAANAIYRRETQDNYPAIKAILHTVYEGLQLPMDLALKVESRWFAKILRSPEARAMIRTLFVSMGELNKGARRPANQPPMAPKKIAVVGAGFMGASIAYVSARAGIDVVLIDKDQESADKGKQLSHKLMTDMITKGRAKTAERDALLAHIEATPDYAKVADCQLVIEAVFEDRAVKAEVTKKIEQYLKPDAIFASNTSTLPITSLAENFSRQNDFIGIHFFSPVEKMMLVEVILGKKTGDKALAMALDFVRAINKTPIVVNDSRGFFANRCVLNYILEGHLMLMEGVPAAMIENLGRKAGMPVGPLSLNDEVALDLGWKILQAAKKDLGPQAVDPNQEKLLEEMVVKQNRLGRKNGKGFYDYPADKGPKKLWPGLAALQPKHLDPDTLDKEELKQRLLVTQALEAARTVEDHVIVDPREADVGSILGFGFAPFTGGVLSLIDGMGARAFVALCQKLESKYGPRFKPNPLLLDMAAKGDTFYGRFGAQKKAAA
ncbi:FAD-dependent oxidoreductase [Methylocella sp. CPCC 101449]|jgi:3-hydroxyacyl-CoA dehydrogenase/enoyl-CoA hydratase/3-hydroxybutyryl-CoA epimerase|uniref:FAD-dependent oxidoreductase n=1 Tax=Methylocella sp. CPCC 101449 TaxID=2987531 RepID=UPI0028922AB7|nr:FAD-dependent oxidoreductase [Methylocella sp. CPCC 101449]MDT2019840.1 3-hydroxyacyl-CoA dehydrogenase NAD-binding domain-containing protein [Methylocella sp. CPCC 101449]HEV2575254.1 FAD-dependent oxidoreductase [Beijerinckiaceae bacterium]